MKNRVEVMDKVDRLVIELYNELTDGSYSDYYDCNKYDSQCDDETCCLFKSCFNYIKYGFVNPNEFLKDGHKI